LMESLDVRNVDMLKKVGAEMRNLIVSAALPDDLHKEISQAYETLSREYGMSAADVAVRSSATAEDLPTASFAGQQETYLNVSGIPVLVQAYQKALASLFTDRAIVYRATNGFAWDAVALSVGVQKMIRSDLASSGVAFSLDTESGFKDVVVINASYGLGESIVQGIVTPDQYIVHKPTLERGFRSLIQKKRGEKTSKIVYGQKETTQVAVSQEDQRKFCLTDDEIFELAQFVIKIEHHYSALYSQWTPMDVEWAQDGQDKKIYIIQARPETVHSHEQTTALVQYHLDMAHPASVVVTGMSIGQSIAGGTARVLSDMRMADAVQAGDVIVTDMTDPDWVPVLKKCAALVTNKGGRTCHAAIVSRELGIPALVGTGDGTTKIKDGQKITVDCSQGLSGVVYDGIVPFTKTVTKVKNLGTCPVDIMINIGDPDRAFSLSFLPVKGVGLARLEFIITNSIGIHPMALLYPEKVTDVAVAKEIHARWQGYETGTAFFVNQLANQISMIAAAFYPRPVIVRTSDFKSNEYRNLLGGSFFEEVEENPMIGVRGACRYYQPSYQEAFALECQALICARNQKGFDTIKIMIPFVRTVQEADTVVKLCARNGIVRGKNGLELYMMCEIPSNVLLIEKFADYFDGFSIGSNDLTQLVLGVDRDSPYLSVAFDERDEAVKRACALAIAGAKKAKKYIGICGQAPSDFPEVATFLIREGIDTISLNPDAVIPFFQSFGHTS
ncbi:MAG TPA: phosphoenolpyruvate synthase, partial [Candidatus Bathyarchaeia archaeon]|nr:phosphoenolpyruvate synthase [Candidatus Bathyarchaeia archaeon]